jgi:chromatin remodeling complex protein RSC6
MPSKSNSKSESESKSVSKQKKTCTSKPKKSSSKQQSASVEVVEQVTVPTETQSESCTDCVNPISTQTQIDIDFNSISEKIAQLKSLQTQIVNDLKKLQKNVSKHIKESNKKKKKVKDPNAPKRSPSGFAKPAPLSNDLCDFLNKPYGTEMARTDVTREITQYIKSENLQDEQNRRIILPDKKLKTLLNSSDVDDNPVTYFNLQKFLRVHFIKKDSGPSVSKTI